MADRCQHGGSNTTRMRMSMRFWGTIPLIVEQIDLLHRIVRTSLPHVSKVLDLGCGDGRSRRRCWMHIRRRRLFWSIFRADARTGAL
ncbi:MAG: hypothetical protein R2849_11535 [Thermomicrobiales bacterium]